MKRFLYNLLLLLSFFFLSGCQVDGWKAGSVTPIISPLPDATLLYSSTPTPLQPTSTPTRFISSKTPEVAASTLSPTSLHLTSTPIYKMCSPLAGISIGELKSVVSNPFSAGRAGFDEGHPGIDFSYWSRGDRKSMQGHGIQSIFSGMVVSTIANRPPYGNSLIIKTQLPTLPSEVHKFLSDVKPIAAVIPDARLNCPGFQLPSTNPPKQDALYILYAHLDQPANLKIGQEVHCGDQIGQVGTSGFSVNYHLHLEIRFGPDGYVFTEMAHYDNAASPTEMRAYCTWRASGIFQALDPALVLGISR